MRILPFALLLATTLAAQPRLVRDINLGQIPVASNPGGFASVGNVTFFFAEDVNGNELWKTDGTEGGTTLVRDIWVGPNSGVPNNRTDAAVVGNRVLFLANDGEHGLEVWSSDGTADGTSMLADVAPGDESSFPVFDLVAGSTAYFVAPSNRPELWQTDGTPGGTRLVKSPAFSSPRGLGAIGSTFFLRAAVDGQFAVFATDGTESGTRLVDSRFAGSGTALGSTVLFTAPHAGAWDLMRIDGTLTGGFSTSVVHPDFLGSAPGSLVVAAGVAYFLASDGISGNEIWRSDGTAGGTYIVADIAEGPASPQWFGGISVMGDRIWFATGGSDNNLFISDGTAAGTHIVKHVPGGTGFVSGDRFYFGFDDGVHGYEPWVSDGTVEGTHLVADIAGGAANGIRLFSRMVPRPDGIFFAADDQVNGREAWLTDGTASGTRMVKNIGRDFAAGSNPDHLAAIGGKLFFTAWDGSTPSEEFPSVWTSDGTEAGTQPVAALESPARIDGGVASGGLYYFSAGPPEARELWRTDGTAAGTFRLLRMHGFGAATLFPFKGGVFFQGSDEEHGREPWLSDGTIAGTRMIADLEPGPEGSYSYDDGTAVAGDWVYFAAGDVSGNLLPWRTDGSAAGTRRLVPAGQDAELPSAFTRVGDDVFFVASVNETAFALWRTSITSGASVLVRRFNQQQPFAMWNAGGALLFTMQGQLWRSDGTGPGTTLVRFPIPVPDCSKREDFTVGDGIFYWYAYDDSVPQLWRSDGTPSGTFPLGTFPGPYSPSLQQCAPHDLHSSAGRLYFIGNDDLHGAEPWVSDGTIAGTHLLHDVSPGPAPSDPGNFLTAGHTLYFTARTPGTGRELWSMCVSECDERRRAIRK